jgi:hypothetical protein
MNPEDYFPKPPEFVFKYFRPARVDFLKDLKIRFANQATFNDPFEAYPRFDLFAEQKADEALRALTALHPLFGTTPEQMAKSVNDYKRQGLKERVKSHAQNYQRECGERFRILCFSESIHSPLMWGHYCDCHAGFALQFETSHQFFRDRLAIVHYNKERPKVDDPLAGYSIPLTKNEEWSYEKEWRIVTETNSPASYFESLPAESIKAIYFGIRMTAVDRQEIETVLNAGRLKHIQKFDMDLDLSAYKLIPIPVIK